MPDRTAIEQFIKDVGKDASLELFELFQSDARTRLGEIQSRKTSTDDTPEQAKEFRRHAHSLKGICRNYGLPDAGNLAFALEKAIDTGDHNAITAAADRVLAEVPGEIDDAMELAGELIKNAGDGD